MSDEEMWAFKDELITEIAEVYARIPSMSHHGEECFRSYAADLIGRCHRTAIEKLAAAHQGKEVIKSCQQESSV